MKYYDKSLENRLGERDDARLRSMVGLIVIMPFMLILAYCGYLKFNSIGTMNDIRCNHAGLGYSYECPKGTLNHAE